MTTNTRKTAELGDLVVAAFDEAARYGGDAAQVSRLATRVIREMLWRIRVPKRKRAVRWFSDAAPPRSAGAAPLQGGLTLAERGGGLVAISASSAASR